MRIWDIPTKKLCDQHLLGEHRELHAKWSIIKTIKKDIQNIQKHYVGKEN